MAGVLEEFLGRALAGCATSRPGYGKYFLAVFASSCVAYTAQMSKKRTPMSEDHKEALSVGRNQGRIVRKYLEGLEAVKPKRGRKRTRETVAARIEAIETEISRAKALRKLELIQERLDLVQELENFDSAVDIDALEKAFIEVGKPYAERRGISYAAFRELGVEANVLKRAGITRAQHQ